MSSSIRIKLNIELKPDIVDLLCKATDTSTADELALYTNVALKAIVLQNIGAGEDYNNSIDVESEVEVIDHCDYIN